MLVPCPSGSSYAPGEPAGIFFFVWIDLWHVIIRLSDCGNILWVIWEIFTKDVKTYSPFFTIILFIIATQLDGLSYSNGF